jgi:hypothetical protein
MNNKLNILIISVVGLAVIGCNDLKTGNQKTSPNVAIVTTSNTEKAKPVEQPFSMLANDLIAAYEKNEADADARYKGKTLVVQGKISNISENAVQITGTNARTSLTVKCDFDESQKGSVSNLKKGQTVTLQGTGNGKTEKLYAALTGCKVL